MTKRIPKWVYDSVLGCVVSCGGVRFATEEQLRVMDQGYELTTFGDPAKWMRPLVPFDAALTHFEFQVAVTDMHGGQKPPWLRLVNRRAAKAALLLCLSAEIDVDTECGAQQARLHASVDLR